MKEVPPTLRLIREDDSIFYINVMECPTWFDFLIRIHHIYSCWLKRHIDAEKCEFYNADTDEALDADSWPSALHKARTYGFCITVLVVLNTRKLPHHEVDRENEAYFIEPDTDTRTWVRMSKRFIDVETLDAFNLPWEEDKEDSTMVIIKTYLDVDFTEVLFEHTRRSRRMRGEDEVCELSDSEAEDRKSVSGDKNRHHTRLAWHWPGCSEKDPADELRRAEGEMFWTPRSSALDGLDLEDEGYQTPLSTHDPSDTSKRPSRHSNNSRAEKAILPYLSWPLASEIPALSRGQEQKTITRVPESQIAHSRKRDPFLVAPKYLYAILQREAAFAKLPSVKKSHLIELQDSFFDEMPTETYYPEIEICNRLCYLVDHFLPDGTECLLKDKIYGGLYTIFKECLKTPHHTKLTRLPQLKDFADRSTRLLKLSSEIRAGIRSDMSRLPLLTAHMDCFMELCRAISHLCCFIQHALSDEHQSTGTHTGKGQPDPTTLDKGLGLDDPGEDIHMAGYSKVDITSPSEAFTMEGSIIKDREVTRSISPQSKATEGSWWDYPAVPSHRVSRPIASTASDHSIKDRSIPRNQKTDPRASAWDDRECDETEPDIHRISWMDGSQALKEAEDLLIESKYSIICTLIETNPLDIDDYIAVGPSRIASSILEHISLGLSDLDGAGSFRLEEIYREYSSQLRIKVRDKPSRTLLDDLDLLEEELECILSAIQKQKTVLEKFMDFVADNISKSRRGSKDVIQNSIRELNDKADLYSEMNSGIEKLRRRLEDELSIEDATEDEKKPSNRASSPVGHEGGLHAARGDGDVAAAAADNSRPDYRSSNSRWFRGLHR
ncbi:hypothetical protein BDV36DRAFT_293611 [Aspergillus pseudocaelatus]|uniref:Uncharacterized protein n=1 Tax=Aspergillus pseudocaelatus TaxID=1825620 RepID=A0ABQ6WSG0_9EURO|nr:hypothetical protein BDV36DRAFT_293611 [Aspergillus pseudocaelatus]